MVVDTSAIVAILLEEEDSERYAQALAEADSSLISAFSMLEASVVLMAKKGEAAVRELDLLVHAAQMTVVAFDEVHAAAAKKAYARFGKGRHSARLNLGDCCSYALASIANRPLLFKGTDFAATDIQSAL